MKNLSLRCLIGIALAGLMLAFTPAAWAGPSPSGSLLKEAYLTLAHADHDYKGHRIEAMKQVEAAGKLLGINVRGDGKNRENQGASDSQLRTAKGLLEQARAGLSGKPLAHVNRAIRQINVALKIR